ncbi:MAG: hypothetical protein COA94_06810 [Rickettsiales bacterium]|nr:MAG: hypothetical protein COA94_06810 [Rickettsiales bacterium]
MADSKSGETGNNSEASHSQEQFDRFDRLTNVDKKDLDARKMTAHEKASTLDFEEILVTSDDITSSTEELTYSPPEKTEILDGAVDSRDIRTQHSPDELMINAQFEYNDDSSYNPPPETPIATFIEEDALPKEASGEIIEPSFHNAQKTEIAAGQKDANEDIIDQNEASKEQTGSEEAANKKDIREIEDEDLLIQRNEEEVVTEDVPGDPPPAPATPPPPIPDPTNPDPTPDPTPDPDDPTPDPDPTPNPDPDPDPEPLPDPPIPDQLGNGNYNIIPGYGISLVFDSLTSNTGYDNSFGHYFVDGDGNPISGAIDFSNVGDTLGEGSEVIVRYESSDIPAGAEQIGFFLIPDGANLNQLSAGDVVTFQNIGGIWTPFINGDPIQGESTPIYFSDQSLNPDGINHMNSSPDGKVGWEDMFGGGDNDFNDAILNITVQSTTDNNGSDDIITGTAGEDVASGGKGDDILIGGAGNDLLRGGANNDILIGNKGDDTLLGGAGNDILKGDKGSDTLKGGKGDDDLFGGSGADILKGGAGDDMLFGGSGADTLKGGGGADTLKGGSGDDNLFGGAGDDTLLGGGGADTLKGGAGDDNLFGGAGDDTLLGGGGADVLKGGGGADTLKGGAGDDNLFGGSGDDTLLGGGGADTLKGGGGADTLKGGAGDDNLFGGSGKDILFGGSGADVLKGGGGADTIKGGAGNDILYGDQKSNNDTELVQLPNGNYLIPFGVGFTISLDSIISHAGYNNSIGHYFANSNGDPIAGMIDFANVKDTLGVGEPSVSVYAPENLPSGVVEVGFFLIPNGDRLNHQISDGDEVTFTLNNQGEWTPVLDGTELKGQGDPVFFSDSALNVNGFDYTEIIDQNPLQIGFEDLKGGGDNDFNDVVVNVDIKQNSTPEDDILIGGKGDDILFGGAGIDTAIFKGNADDYIITHNKDGSITVEDTVPDRDGTDIVHDVEKLEFKDTTIDVDDIDPPAPPPPPPPLPDPSFSGTSDEYIFTSNGDGTFTASDTVPARDGDQTFQGGADLDFTDKTYTTTNDTIIGTDGDDVMRGGAGDEIFKGGKGNDNISGGAGNDTILGGKGDDTIDGGDGADIIYSGDGDDIVDAGAGDDIVIGGLGNDNIQGGAGNDVINAGSGDDIVDGGIGDDSIAGGAGADTIDGGDGDDWISGGDGNDAIIAGKGADVVFGNKGDDNISGNEGADTIYGNEGTDIIDGGADNDTLHGGDGNDIIDGGDGDDLIVGDKYGYQDPQLLPNGNYGVPEEGGLHISIDSIYSTTTGSNNSLGYYFADENGEPISGHVAFADSKDSLWAGDPFTIDYNSEDIPAGATQIGLFIIPDGETENPTLTDGSAITFQNIAGQWTPMLGGAALKGDQGVPAFFSDSNINVAGFDYTNSNYDGTRISFEDFLGGGDNDFNDVVADISIKTLYNGPDNNDTLTGGAGNDTILGGAGDDNISGGDGDDDIHGGIGDNIIAGNDGDDWIESGSGADNITGGLGADTIQSNAGDDIIDSGDGNDKVFGGAGADDIKGGAGDDYISAGSGDDTVDAGDGNDIVLGNTGTNTLSGGKGHDYLVSGDGDDSTLFGNEGDDHLYGGSSNNTLIGGEGDDVIVSSGKSGTFNALFGDEGDDILKASDGSNFFDGGTGNDIAIFEGAYSEYIITIDFVGDIVVTDTVADRNGDNTLTSVETLQFSDGTVLASDIIAGNPIVPNGLIVADVTDDWTDAISKDPNFVATDPGTWVEDLNLKSHDHENDYDDLDENELDNNDIPDDGDLDPNDPPPI